MDRYTVFRWLNIMTKLLKQVSCDLKIHSYCVSFADCLCSACWYRRFPCTQEEGGNGQVQLQRETVDGPDLSGMSSKG